MIRYTASKVRGTGRESWAITFRHPIRMDHTGKVGLRIKKGLGTSDEVEAQKLIDQMNDILATPSMWDLAARDSALTRYDPKIVAAFYDAMDPKQRDYTRFRDLALPLPDAQQGFARVLLVGTTGAGKTTLLRQLIGSDPKRDRFPSTSPNKTTVSDIEVICSPGSYQAVVTFFDLREVRIHIEDCVMAAVLAKVSGLDNSVVAQRLLEHAEQRFRFFYVLGTPDMDKEPDEDEWDEEESEEVRDADDALTSEEKAEFATVLRSFLDRVGNLAETNHSVRETLSRELSLSLTSLTLEDRQAFEELLDEEIRQNKDFHSLVDDMLDAIAGRFSLLQAGITEFDSDEWPTTWKFATDNRDEFIETVRRFSSNYAPHFGKLLTPLVQGIRVKGPFAPQWATRIPRVVFIDGQGIGHTASSSTSLPTQTARRFESSDAVVLVDSAKSPMQAASLAVLRSLAASGHISKLRICFTHLDDLKGDNLPTRKSRVAHVAASLHQAVNHIRESLGQEVATNLDVLLSERTYYLSNLDQSVQNKDQPTLKALQDLIGALESAIFQDASSEVMPIYDETNVVIAVQHATKRFHESWRARLGFAPMADEPPQHWTRVKALTRRLAWVLDDGEYGNLRPVAELRERLMEQIRIYLNQPVRWLPGSATEEEKKVAVDRIAREIHSRLLGITTQRLWTDRLVSWNTAHDLTGRGSGMERSRSVQRILDQACPIPGSTASLTSQDFLTEIRQAVRSAITAGGGRLL